MKTIVKFENDIRIHVIAPDGENIWLNAHSRVPVNDQQYIANLLALQFDENISDDKSGMIYSVLCKTMIDAGFSFSYVGSDRSEERKRIGEKIRLLREEKGFDAKKLATLADIDAANLCRIEQGRYSVGIDILSKIANVLGAKVDLIQI